MTVTGLLPHYQVSSYLWVPTTKKQRRNYSSHLMCGCSTQRYKVGSTQSGCANLRWVFLCNCTLWVHGSKYAAMAPIHQKWIFPTHTSLIACTGVQHWLILSSYWDVGSELQRWALSRCRRKYNGAEALNKALKYKFLPRSKSMTLSGIVTLLIERFVPDMRQMYVFKNYKQSGVYRSYNDKFVPTYHQGRPRLHRPR